MGMTFWRNHAVKDSQKGITNSLFSGHCLAVNRWLGIGFWQRSQVLPPSPDAVANFVTISELFLFSCSGFEDTNRDLLH